MGLGLEMNIFFLTFGTLYPVPPGHVHCIVGRYNLDPRSSPSFSRFLERQSEAGNGLQGPGEIAQQPGLPSRWEISFLSSS